MRKKDIKIEEKEWAKEKDILTRRQRIKQERAQFKPAPSTSKLLVFFLFLNCTIIEIFTMWATVRSFQLAEVLMYSPDFTPLVTLIGSVVSECIGFAVYALKAKAENVKGGLSYMLAERQFEQPNVITQDDQIIGATASEITNENSDDTAVSEETTGVG